jgi:hypothetical protein
MFVLSVVVDVEVDFYPYLLFFRLVGPAQIFISDCRSSTPRTTGLCFPKFHDFLAFCLRQSENRFYFNIGSGALGLSKPIDRFHCGLVSPGTALPSTGEGMGYLIDRSHGVVLLNRLI